MNFKLLLTCLCACSLSIQAHAQNKLTVVPLPKEINETKTAEFTISNGFSISAAKELRPLAELLTNDMYTLYGIHGKAQKGANASIVLSINKALAEETYELTVSDNQILIAGHDYNSAAMGVTTLLQMGKQTGSSVLFPAVSVKDTPSYGYRTFMLDVARQPTDIETIKQSVELCRWYKVKYLQLHLSDDPLFTFPSKKYPKLATENVAYTLEELKELVEFAKVRGVMITPEFDVPGHTWCMREKMPELFGKPELFIIDITKPEVRSAVKAIILELMDVFYTSPYFHIGGDEALLGNFAHEEHVKEYIRNKGFDNEEDVYLEFIVELHEFIKKQGRQTIVWEGFKNNGSKHIQVPTDLLVIAWETLYQRPESLLKHNYTIMNASWKPMYICPGLRWSPEYIHSWNPRRWENHWVKAPSYHNPIQLPEYVHVKGVQMCAWEMNDAQQISSIHQRVPVFGEIAWHDGKPTSYQEYEQRFEQTDDKFMRLIFPAELNQKGFRSKDVLYNLDHNQENTFTDKGTICVTPSLPNTFVTYTTDGSKPTKDSPKASTLTLSKNENIRFGVFNAQGEMIGYRHHHYILRPITVSFEGNMEPVKDRNIVIPKEAFKDKILVKLTCKDNVQIYYTTDGKAPSTSSTRYDGQGVLVDRNLKLQAQGFVNGQPYGEPYVCDFMKIEK